MDLTELQRELEVWNEKLDTCIPQAHRIAHDELAEWAHSLELHNPELEEWITEITERKRFLIEGSRFYQWIHRSTLPSAIKTELFAKLARMRETPEAQINAMHNQLYDWLDTVDLSLLHQWLGVIFEEGSCGNTLLPSILTHLVEMGNVESIEWVGRFLSEERLRYALDAENLIEALGERGEAARPAVPGMLVLLDSWSGDDPSEAWVRAKCAHALGEIGDPRACPALDELTTADDQSGVDIAGIARRALAKLAH